MGGGLGIAQSAERIKSHRGYLKANCATSQRCYEALSHSCVFWKQWGNAKANKQG